MIEWFSNAISLNDLAKDVGKLRKELENLRDTQSSRLYNVKERLRNAEGRLRNAEGSLWGEDGRPEEERVWFRLMRLENSLWGNENIKIHAWGRIEELMEKVQKLEAENKALKQQMNEMRDLKKILIKAVNKQLGKIS
ncbi:MAG: hypothetical protein IJB31_02960 [Akkermansia sp.]|nr:hypothetical protein [Akkermansia sp.]